jgi:integrase
MIRQLNVAELAKLPKARKKLKRRNSWTVDEARNFLETSRSDDDLLYPLSVLIVVLGLRKGETLGLIWPEGDDSWPTAGDDGAELRWSGSSSGLAGTRSLTSTSSRRTAAPTRCRCRRSASRP